MSTTDKTASRKQDAAEDGMTVDAMAERLRLAVAIIEGTFLYRSEALDALGFTLTGMKSGPARDVAVVDTLARLVAPADAGNVPELYRIASLTTVSGGGRLQEIRLAFVNSEDLNAAVDALYRIAPLEKRQAVMDDRLVAASLEGTR